jgi:hypothetical protein
MSIVHSEVLCMLYQVYLLVFVINFMHLIKAQSTEHVKVIKRFGCVIAVIIILNLSLFRSYMLHY